MQGSTNLHAVTREQLAVELKSLWHRSREHDRILERLIRRIERLEMAIKDAGLGVT